MDLFSLQFLSSLGAIVVIDLMLAGDNAIVIALAARNVPRHLQKRVIALGTLGAVAMRVLMTLVVVWLLQVPGLLFAGGAALVWIAYRLLVPDHAKSGGADSQPQAIGLWAALRTIVVADAVMGLDNVLAVAGAAHGSYVLVVLGLLISIPIVVWGSTWILQWVERHPAIVYVGAGVLAWTAAKMIASEALVRDSLADRPIAAALLYAATIAGVLGAGFARNHRRLDSRIRARVAAFAASVPPIADPAWIVEKGNAMRSVLVPVGTSRNSLRAVRRVIAECMKDPAMKVHLLNVQAPFSQHIARHLRQRTREEFHRERAEVALAPARALLRRHGIACQEHVRLGDRARVIAAEAERLGCDHIVMATARSRSLTRMLEDSVTHRVLELTDVPLELVAGDEVSKLERYGVPAGVGTALAFLLAEALD